MPIDILKTARYIDAISTAFEAKADIKALHKFADDTLSGYRSVVPIKPEFSDDILIPVGRFKPTEWMIELDDPEDFKPVADLAYDKLQAMSGLPRVYYPEYEILISQEVEKLNESFVGMTEPLNGLVDGSYVGAISVVYERQGKIDRPTIFPIVGMSGLIPLDNLVRVYKGANGNKDKIINELEKKRYY